MEKRKQIVILAAGDFPRHEVAREALQSAGYLVCCDSAYEGLERMEEKPRCVEEGRYVVTGDGDSLPEEKQRQLGERFVRVEEQDYNDLHKAMRLATAMFGREDAEYTILGATGRREDHTIGNISYLVSFAKEYPGARVEMLTDYGRFCALSGSQSLETFKGQQVSIFSLTPECPITGEGLRWPLEKRRVELWWQATLNEAMGERVRLETEGWIVVFRTYENKAFC